ncbi:unnamed protein product, partial [Allacma fusca]
MTKPFLMSLFLKTKEVEVIPRTWMVEEEVKKYSYWPKSSSLEEIYTAAKSQNQPNKKIWKKFAIEVYFEFDTYEEAVGQIPHFLDYSDYDIAGSSFNVSSKLSVKTPQSSILESDDDSPTSVPTKFLLGPVLPHAPHVPKVTTQSHSKSVPIPPLTSYPVATASTSGAPPDVTFESSIRTQNSFQFDSEQNIFQEIRELKAMCARNFASLRLHQDTMFAALEALRLKESTDAGSLMKPRVNFGFPFQELSKFLEFDEK